MSAFGVIFDTFFDGPTGREIARLGGSDGQLVATYLLKNADDNMIGLYPLNLAVMRERIGTIPAERIEPAMWALGEAGFADYDLGTTYVWVRELARVRLRLAEGEALSKEDRRAIGARALYLKAKANPFLSPFFRRYRQQLGLSSARRFSGDWKRPAIPFDTHSRPLGSQVPEPEITKQTIKSDQEDQEQRAVAHAVFGETRKDAKDAHRVLVKLAHETFDARDRGEVIDLVSELSTHVKELAAARGIPYDSIEVTKALESADRQRPGGRA